MESKNSSTSDMDNYSLQVAVSLDVMELNPALDVRNRTAELAVDLIESLFGKSTLMRKN